MKLLLTLLLGIVTVAPTAVSAEGDDSIAFKLHGSTLIYSPTTLPTIKILQDGKEDPMWYTPVSTKNFITAAKVNDTVLQNGGNFIFPNSTPIAICNDMSITSVSGGVRFDRTMFAEFQGLLCGKPAVNFTLTFSSRSTSPGIIQLLIEVDENTLYNQIRLSSGCEKDEQFYGFGVQYSVFNMKGRRLPVFLSEQGVGRGLEPFTSILDMLSPGAGGTWHTTYTNVPQYMTSYNRSLGLASMPNIIFDMTMDDTVTIELTGFTLLALIRSGDSILDLITSYTADLGRLKPLPPWIGQGAVLGLQGGTEAVQKTLEQVESQWGNLSDVVGVWLQDWTGQRVFKGPKDLPRTGLWWNWEVDTTHYPKWTELISDLLSKGIRTLTYINPLFSNVTQRGTPYTHNYLEEGLKNDYFIKREDGTVWTGYGDSCMADLTQEKVVEWMTKIITENMLATGVCGWMCDFGESVPLQYKPAPSSYPDPNYHSDYPYIWGGLNLNAIMNDVKNSLCDPDDVVFFMRSGNYISPYVSRAFWLGDQLVTWDSFDGMGTVVIGMLTGGFSGYSSTHSDIGGYTAIHQSPFKYVRTKELFMRWCELAAFTTIYRSHLGTLPDENWQFNSDNETLQHFFKMAVVFQSWGFYRQQLMEEAAEKGWPVARHMILVFPHDPKVFELSEELKYQFMLGTELLVAPVLQPFDSTSLVPFVKVFLPANTEWVHVWTNTVYQGADQFVSIDTPPGKPCVLYVSGSQVGKQFVENLKSRHLL